jgi:AraC family transcriptional regulator, regulatory protein of adaptative response / DNA-3-methyladenine glycosylase II
MQGVSGVVTTGIYCRPGCSAQPLAQHVRKFPVAAAAEAAGFRACLRCRPYRDPVAVTGIQPELVCRGVRMILDGALDHGTEAGLAGRLGVSGRHLRRLFLTHLGVTPDGLARSARAHFARRLLDDTDLTITEIAFAAGFGSPRQLNRDCRAVFRASPSDLRAKRRRSDRLVADGGLALRLAFNGSLDWEAVLAILGRTAIPGVEHVSDGVYRRTVEIAGDPAVLELSSGDEHHLLLRAHLPHWEGLMHVVQRARGIASLDADVDEPAGQLGRDPIIGPLVRAHPGVRVPGTWDGFETGIRAIVGQTTATADANATVGRLVDRYGTPAAGLGDLGLTHVFPRPDALAEADLSGLGLAPAKESAIHALAAAAADGTVCLDRSVPLARLVDSLTALPGVGASAAHYMALRLGEPDAFPLSDQQVARRLRMHRDATRAAATTVDRWRPWRALAVTHLWLADGKGGARRQRGAA